MSNKPVTDTLKKVLADTYALMLKTQNYHWNVEGENFNGLHNLFEQQYNELFQTIDVIAERLRALGEKAPGTFAQFTKLKSIADGDSELDSASMVKDLYKSNQQVLATIQDARQKAEKAGDEATIDLYNQRTAAHDKASWMLKSSLPPAQRAKLAA